MTILVIKGCLCAVNLHLLIDGASSLQIDFLITNRIILLIKNPYWHVSGKFRYDKQRVSGLWLDYFLLLIVLFFI